LVKYIIIILFSLTCYIGFSQKADSSLTLLRSYGGDIEDAAIDNLDNLYIITSSGSIKKFAANGDSVAVYNGVRNYGKLSSIDVSNPLKLLLFYKDFSTVVILDRLLAVRANLNLRKHNILQPSAIGLSYDNNIWVYDEYDSKLKKIDEQGSLQLQTSDFRSIFQQSVRPQKIINDNGFVYLADSTEGIFVFDNYGTFKRRVAINNWNSIEIRNGYIIRTARDEVLIYNPSTFVDQSRKLPPSFKPYLRSFTNSNKFVTFSKDALQIYKIRL
jgi:hypothetical protein